MSLPSIELTNALPPLRAHDQQRVEVAESVNFESYKNPVLSANSGGKSRELVIKERDDLSRLVLSTLNVEERRKSAAKAPGVTPK